MMTSMAHKSGGRWRLAGWSLAAGALLVPFVAMRFTSEVNWSPADFVVMGALLAMVGGAIEFLVRRSSATSYRVGAALAVVTALFLVWVNLAVGIIGSEQNDANAMYAAVLAIAVAGSMIARFGARGMCRTMLATAAAQCVVAAIALAFDLGTEGPAWPRDVIGVTAIVTTLWLVAAALFHRAARD